MQKYSTLKSLGEAYSALGQAGRQKELLERALCIYEGEFGPNHSTIALTLAALGDAHGALGDTQKKREFLQRSLDMHEISFGECPTIKVWTMVALGNAHGELGDIRKQHELLEQALAIHLREEGPDDLIVAATMTHLGKAEGALGNVQKQTELLERALAILEKERHRNTKDVVAHHLIADTLTNLGEAFGSLGQAGRQKELLERALAIYEREFGEAHPKTADTLAALGDARGSLADLAKSWGSKVHELERFVIGNNGFLPRRSAASDEEKRWAMWIGNQQQLYRKDKLPEEKLALLKRVPGMPTRILLWQETRDNWQGEQAADAGRRKRRRVSPQLRDRAFVSVPSPFTTRP